MTTPDDDEPRTLDDWLRSFYRDSALGPVVLVVAGSLAAIGGGVIAWAVRGRSLAAIAALLLLGGMTVDAALRDRRRRGRLGLAVRSALALWALSAIAAAGAIALGLA